MPEETQLIEDAQCILDDIESCLTEPDDVVEIDAVELSKLIELARHFIGRSDEWLTMSQDTKDTLRRFIG